MQRTPHQAHRPPVVSSVLLSLALAGLALVGAAPAQTAAAATVTGQLTGPAGKCLSTTGTNAPAVIKTCDQSASQSWSVPGDKTLRSGGQCLDVTGGGTAAGTRVGMWSCNGSGAQEWVPGANGQLVNTRSNLCLDAVNGSSADGTPVQIYTCNGTWAQQWTLPTGTGTGGGTGGTLGIDAVAAQSYTAGVANGFRPKASGGNGQYQWSATGLPAGMSMNYIDGTTMGTPKQSGTGTATVTVTDATGATATKAVGWTVGAATTATGYYLDCNAATNGTGTQASPWNSLATANARTFQPGESLLLKKGSTCTGQLAPKGNGSATAPITISSYGTAAAKPRINGGGLVNPSGTRTSSATVQLTNQNYWIIEDLEVTNDAATEALRSGIEYFGTDGQRHAGITIRNNDVHDVKGWSFRNTNLDNYYLSHGIGVDTPIRGSLVQGLTIADNYVHEIHGVGVGLYGDQSNWNNNEERHENTLISGNTVKNDTHDAIVVSVSDAPLIEHNTADQLGWQHGEGVYAGIWGWGNTNPTFQYNEVSNISVLTDDSVAWDCDGYNRGTCTYQYNYDHDNANGILLTCASCGGSEAMKAVFRYNVSVNDCRLHNYTGSLASYAFYGNTVDCRNKNWDFGEVPSLTQFSNNVFLGKAGSALPAGPTYKANTYYGFTPPSGDTAASTADPKPVALPSASSYGINTVGGYQLLAGSPALGTGTAVTNNLGHDYWGNPLNTAAPNRGAYGGTGLATPVRTDDNSATYSGSWSTLSCGGCTGGSAHTTSASGASATFTATGRTISLYGVQSSTGGTATVSIDGGAPVAIDLYTPGATANGQLVYTSPQLASGSHTVTVTNTGTADPRSTGTAVTLDSWTVS
ncbi:RICIN domain-containing protein [Kitasatospora cineracea]|uniref:RICIN domain-containing protein n=1 Tax=Kitasatospora cineracea TaxID=88074 RepID=UPI003448A858